MTKQHTTGKEEINMIQFVDVLFSSLKTQESTKMTYKNVCNIVTGYKKNHISIYILAKNKLNQNFFFCFSRATPVVYGGSQARHPMGAVATSLCQSHSNRRSELRLQPTPQLIAMPDP